MHLKAMTLRGFKSFASATTLRFEPGITCVVGPNGSGKSNVVDALSWVMGEQGAKSLRGGKMEDVIFAGTTGRPPLGRAEVSLTIDNSDGALPIEYAEVTITRIMFRNGGSEYQINGDTCRLLDIQELLSDSGIGREMHVIVGQGQLDSVLHADPMGRRAFIEEAAGVLKHRKRKEKALRKLDAMRANLARVQDLTEELRRQLKPLGRQAAVARRAAVIQADLRDARLRLLADDLVTLTRALSAEIADEAEQKRRRDVAEAELKAAQRREADLEGEVRRLAPRLLRAQETWHALSQLAERVRGTIGLADARVRSASAEPVEERRGRDPEELEREAARIREQEAELAASLEAVQHALEDTVGHRAELERALAAEERRLKDVARAIADRREGLARLHGQVNAARSRAASAQEEIDRLAAARDEAAAAPSPRGRSTSSSAPRSTASTSPTPTSAPGTTRPAPRSPTPRPPSPRPATRPPPPNAAAPPSPLATKSSHKGCGARTARANCSRPATGSTESRAPSPPCWTSPPATRCPWRPRSAPPPTPWPPPGRTPPPTRSGCSGNATRGGRRWCWGGPEVTGRAGRCASARGDRGRPDGARAVPGGDDGAADPGREETADAATGRGTGRTLRIHGTGRAVAGRRTTARRVTGRRTASVPRAKARGARRGPPRTEPRRTTPARRRNASRSVSRARPTPPAGRYRARPGRGGAPSADRPVPAACGGPGAGARRPGSRAPCAARRHGRGRRAERGGDGRRGRGRGGRRGHPRRRRSRAALRPRRLRRRTQPAGGAGAGGRGRRRTRRPRHAVRGTRRRPARRRPAPRRTGDPHRGAGRTAPPRRPGEVRRRPATRSPRRAGRAAAGEAERSTAAAARAQEALDRAVADAEELAERLAVAEEAPAQEEPDTAVRDRLSADGANARQTEMEARLQLRTHEERVRALAGRADGLDRAARAERETWARAERRRARLRHEAHVAAAVATGARQLLAHIEISVERAAAERVEAERAKAAREAELDAERSRGRDLKAELDKLTDSVHRGEVLGAEKRLRIEQLETRALEELGVEPAALVAEYGPEQPVPPSPPAEGEEPPEDPEHPRHRPRPFHRAEQEKRLRAAERAYQQLGKVNPLALEEFAALEERHQFLSEQLDDLRRTRADLLQVVKEVDERVEQVFTEAYHDTAREFEGVFSRLFPGGEGRLVLTDPEHMLTTGVDVEARPPGKKVKRLSLLSGGERSLTAVALLVSIFKARPSPFYVMDEVEAALDDTNLQRLIRIMQELQESSQLIVITHQKRTMEVADALYGVSMQGDGVSKVIGQRLR
ncbi:AAA family ATPase [Streptomyces sp. S399]|uniref:AAA family ATPase n=1 Tax=Streptomyces sp. S399 TaxID=3096009 RepID=UPI0039C1375E